MFSCGEGGRSMSTNNGKHLTLEKRKIIRQYLTRGAKLIEISYALEVDPTTVSKEIKKHRSIVTTRKVSDKRSCKKTKRYPYVCDGCSQRYKCKREHYTYLADLAQKAYQRLLVSSRQGISLSEEEFQTLNTIVKDGVDNKDSIYHIIHSHKEIDVSVATVYRYIHGGILDTKAIDLPRAVKYKKRKKYKKKYDYPKTELDLESHTYMDYLEFKLNHPNVFTVQMDYLGHIISDTKTILTLNISDIHFPLLFLLKKQTLEHTVEVFNRLEDLLGIDDFKKIFPCILTDRDPCFKPYLAYEASHNTGEIRTSLFYCDAYRSAQKASVENMNAQIRKYIKKNESIQNYTVDDVKYINRKLLESKVASLGGRSPKEVFIRLFGQELFDLLMSF